MHVFSLICSCNSHRDRNADNGIIPTDFLDINPCSSWHVHVFLLLLLCGTTIMFSVWIGCLVSKCPIIKLSKFCIETECFWKTILIFYMDIVKYAVARAWILGTYGSDYYITKTMLHPNFQMPGILMWRYNPRWLVDTAWSVTKFTKI